jgi:hypothetical protein
MAHEIKRMIFNGVIKKVDIGEHTVEAIVSDESLDRHKERVLAKAFKKRLKVYKSHPVLLSGHEYGSLRSTIGKAAKIEVKDNALHATFKYFVGEGNAEADWGFKLAQEGIAAFSIGFIAHAFDEFNDEEGDDGKNKGEKQARRVYTDIELMEVSQVGIPANPNALQKGLHSDNPVIKDVMQKMVKTFPEEFKFVNEYVIPYKKCGLIEEHRSWFVKGALERIRGWAGWDGKSLYSVDPIKFQTAFTWSNKENDIAFHTYKILHHDIKDGNICTHWRGVVTAMATLLSGNGDTTIPEEDRQGIYDHLAAHYKDFNKEVPEFKSYYNVEDILSGCKDVETGMTLAKVMDDIRNSKAIENVIKDTIEKATEEMTKKVIKMVDAATEKLSEINMVKKKTEPNEPEKSDNQASGNDYIKQALQGIEETNKVLSG